ncbi:hypothetical protein BV372_08860 [Nostoc sp. T09]|uniref:hypothetical protein n=1 Tax=Nostoc sp. T09 TaxID=1932621 RepID=UPI000A3655CC|nr:hypothetical protein [Nostoc sp. T09]OUL35999.1 hypothetical protein BV372_08860 [Nostoc sp. T09]
MNKRWEVGSEFDWSNELVTVSASNSLLPEPYELFSTGTACLILLESLLNPSKINRLRLHIPSFLCMHFVGKLKKIFDICWYRDLPTQESPDFQSLNPLAGDLVLAVNLFGIRQGKLWQDWQSQHQDIILIEDHSHDPFSAWAQESKAHYAIASLRKTLPIPNGGMIWSPQKMSLPQAICAESSASYKKLTAMLLKQAYLGGANISKHIYRQLEIESEIELETDFNYAVSIFTSQILRSLNISEFRQKREINVKYFLNSSLIKNSPYWQPLFTSWPSGSVAFNSIIVCQSQEIRDALRNYLIAQNIFPAIHWQQTPEHSSKDPLAIDLSNRILTIPTDQRYCLDDIAYISEKITDFSQKYGKFSLSLVGR